MSQESAVFLVTLPLLAAIGALLGGKRAGFALSIATSIFSLLLSLHFCLSLQTEGSFVTEIGGLGTPLGINLRVNGLNVLMLITTAVVILAASIYSRPYFDDKRQGVNEVTNRQKTYFWPLWLLVFGGLNALFLSSDIFNLYVCLEVMTFAAIALTTINGTPLAISAALSYLFISTMGSLVYLMGVALLYSSYSALDFKLLSTLIEPNLISDASFSFIASGLIIKSALFPFHFWLPPAHSNAPAPVSAILSALVVMAAFYLLVEFWFELFINILNPILGQIVGIMALLSIFYGSFRALFEERLKMLIAYSTVSQIGYMFLIFVLATKEAVENQFAWNGAIYFALSHALAKASLFMAAGSIIYAFNHDTINDLKGLAKQHPMITFTIALAGVSLIGLPPSGGFIGKWQLLKAAVFSGQWWYAFLLLAGSLITACYVFRVLDIALTDPGDANPTDPPRRVPLSMQYSALILSLMAIFMGIVPSLPLDIMNIYYRGS